MILPKLPADLQCSMELASEKGASNWLSALPLEKYGFALHKGAFHAMLYAFAMAGYQKILLIESAQLLIMHSSDLLVVSLSSDIMN